MNFVGYKCRWFNSYLHFPLRHLISLHGNCRPELKIQKNNGLGRSKVAPHASLSGGNITSSMLFWWPFPNRCCLRMDVAKLKKFLLPLVLTNACLSFQNDITWFAMKDNIDICILHISFTTNKCLGQLK
jgi:hypothetical protein